MGFWSGLKKGLDFVFYIRPKQWFGWDSFKYTTTRTYGMIKDIYKIPTATKIETFNQAVERHNLDDLKLNQIKNRFYLFSMFFLTCAIGVFIYAVDGFWNNNIMKGFVSLSLVSFLAAQSFRYHFWYFQICQRKLGCSFYDWVAFLRT